MANYSPGDEYRDLSDNMRHYANMRFAQLTLYIAVSAGIATAVFLTNPELRSSLRTVLKLVGIVVAIAFGVMEERAVTYWRRYHRRAVDLEKELGYAQYQSSPTATVLSATNSARVLVWGGAVLWVCAVLFRV